MMQAAIPLTAIRRESQAGEKILSRQPSSYGVCPVLHKLVYSVCDSAPCWLALGPDGSLYFTDDGDVAALRYDNWKMMFMEQRVVGTLQVWAEQFTELRVPKIFNLRTDPYERADITSNTYYDWLLDHVFILVPAQAGVAQFLTTFKEFPPRQKAASFGIDQVMEKMMDAAGGAKH